MSAEYTLGKYADAQGWDVDTMLDLCLEYINNQGDNSTFSAFLSEKCADEEEDQEEEE